jgi:hypothetical protein
VVTNKPRGLIRGDELLATNHVGFFLEKIPYISWVGGFAAHKLTLKKRNDIPPMGIQT